MALIESTSDPIWSVDLDCRLITFNQAFSNGIKDIFGITIREGMEPADYLSPEGASSWSRTYRRVLVHGSFRVESELAAGRIREFSLNPIIVDGVLAGVSVFGKDIAEQKRAELARRDRVREAAVHSRAAMEADLRHAIDTKQFVLHYQPQFKRGRVIGVEALLRWAHPARGILLPDEFIPLAEETGLILPLGLWVLESVCEQLAKWAKHKETAGIRVALNISALQLHHPQFVESVRRVLRATGANPRNLNLELTESVLVTNVAAAKSSMEQLKSLGCRVSLDDFGTGYSSLSYLKRLPLDCLKIDRSFVRDIAVDKNSKAIARSIVSLSRAMGLSVIAEGVETEQQWDCLQRIGCREFQGFLFSRPAPVDELSPMLHGHAGLPAADADLYGETAFSDDRGLQHAAELVLEMEGAN